MDELAMKNAITVLLAKQAITEALYGYCRGEDRVDAEISAATWHPDGTAMYGYEGELFNGTISEYIAATRPQLASFTGTSHQISNILIEVDGDLARSETCVTARVWNTSDAGELWLQTILGRYLDRWSCREGRWAIDHRRFIFDLAYSSTTPEPNESGDTWVFEGRQDPSDPSYEHLGAWTNSRGG